MPPINILILTAPFGNGHLVAANSLAETFKEEGCTVSICDIFTESHPVLTSNISKTHHRLFSIGSTYSYFYYGIDKLSATKLINLYRLFGYQTLKRVIKTFKPDIIVNTFPVLSAPEFMRKYQLGVPVINVVTDFCCHRLWITDNFDRIYLATDDLKERLVKMNIPVNKLEVTGIPIRNDFEKPFDKQATLEKYGLPDSPFTLLVSAGAKGVLKDLDLICKDLSTLSSIQILVVCGTNLKLKTKIDAMNLSNVKTFGYVETIHELYKLANLMITKPGGITLSEASACNLPLILVKPVPGQEKENAAYFSKKGAALIAKNKEEILEKTVFLLKNPSKLDEMRHNLQVFRSYASSQKIVRDLLSRYVN
jgi:processive 1,2-diacylglycerol beta-glucosyltransferase